MASPIQILPSLLAADFGRLAAEIQRCEAAGADGIHLDIMDGHFVPNLSMGPDIVRMARRTTALHLHVHLMVSRPSDFVDAFADAGADSLLVHCEAEGDSADVLRRIRDHAMRPGIVLNPDTAPERVFPVLALADEVLCMTVYPGYGGQSFLPGVLPTIRRLRQHGVETGRDLPISVDGGIDLRTVGDCAAAGATVFAAGSSLFRAASMADAIAAMRKAAESSGP